jgi:hypothetical protein
MRKFKGMDFYIPDDLYVPFHNYGNPRHVMELWNEWKTKDTTKMRKEAFDYVQRWHSSKNRLSHVLGRLNLL